MHIERSLSQYDVDLIEVHAVRDHIHTLLMIPPKHNVSDTFGFLKGKSAIRIFRDSLGLKVKRQKMWLDGIFSCPL